MPVPAVKAMEVADILRERIGDGLYADQLPGVNLLADELGVNQRTITRGMSALEDEGVVKRVPRVGTFVTRLRRERTNMIGAVMGDPSAPMGSRLTSGMQLTADNRRQGLVMGAYRGDYDTQLARIRDLVEGNRVDGLVLWLTDSTVERAAIDYLREQNVPCVLVPESDLEIAKQTHTVSNAYCRATADVITHLVGLGHRDIAFVGRVAEQETFFHQHRYAESSRSMRIASLAVRDALTISMSEDPGQGPELSPGGAAALREVTAVFCETDRAAALVHQVCVDEGIRVPRDLAIVGYDNSDMAHWLGLTSVDQHFEEIGRKAVELLLDDIEGNLAEPVHLEVASELVIRRSTVGSGRQMKM